MAKIIDGLVLNGQSYEFTATDINLADIETDQGAASKAYAVGDHLILDGQYYIVTAPIAENDGLVVDTNIRVEKVGNEITGLSTDYKGKGRFHQDLNDIKVSCNFLAYGNCLNRPTTDNQWYTVSVIAGGTGSVIQEAVNARTHRKYYRHNNGESWSSWEIVPTGDFMFRNNNGQAQYSMDNGTTWKDFKHPVGAKSITANGEYDITDYASASVNVLTNCDTVGFSGSPWGTASFPRQIYMYRFIICHGANWQYIILRNNTPRTGNSWVIQQVENFTYQGIIGNNIQFAQTQNASSGYRAYGIY